MEARLLFVTLKRNWWNTWILQNFEKKQLIVVPELEKTFNGMRMTSNFEKKIKKGKITPGFDRETELEVWRAKSEKIICIFIWFLLLIRK